MRDHELHPTRARMRLSQLIRDRKEAILQDFAEFAKTHTTSGTSMDIEALRDHAGELLDDFARQLDRPDRLSVAHETARVREGDSVRPAKEHGAQRARSGFSLDETFAEYRALRSSVMRRWMGEDHPSGSSDVEDVIRLNEIMDKAIAGSIHEYARAVAGYREMFLAVLGHDLRSPLNAILNASGFLEDVAELPERDLRLVQAIRGSGAHMKDLVDDMLNYTSAQLGPAMPLRRASTDLGKVVGDVVQQGRVAHPEREFRAELNGNLSGEWDGRRIQQALLNLVENAAQHGAAAFPITISAVDVGEDVVVSVHNVGEPIPPKERERIFEPFHRGSSGEVDRAAGNVGLGLYIARRMAEAHGGSIDVRSSRDRGTTFSLTLPRSGKGGTAGAAPDEGES